MEGVALIDAGAPGIPMMFITNIQGILPWGFIFPDLEKKLHL